MSIFLFVLHMSAKACVIKGIIKAYAGRIIL